MKKISTLFASLVALAMVSCNNNEETILPNGKGEEIMIGVTASSVNYEPLPASRAGEPSDLMAVAVYIVEEDANTPYATGLFSDWSAISFKGYSGLTYSIEATMIVDGTEKIKATNSVYGKPFSCELTNDFEYTQEPMALSSSVATLSDGAEYTTPTIDRYYGAASKSVSAESNSINVAMKRMSFGLRATATNSAELSVIVEGAPEVTLGSDIIYYSLNNILEAYEANESEALYSEIMEVEVIKDGASLSTEPIEFFRNKLATISISKDDFTVGFDFEESFIRTLTFEDEDYKAGANMTGKSSWTSLIDTPQYGGLLLYGEGGYGSDVQYKWADTNNTYLQSEMIMNYGSYAFWNGAHAISNYVDNDLVDATYDKQLAVYLEDATTGNGGHNGSANFCIHNGYMDASQYSATELPKLSFTDNKERIIDHMYVCNTTYFVSIAKYGNDTSAALGATDYMKIVATGYAADGSKTGTAEYMLAENGTFAKGWNKFSMSSLGKVSYVEFNVVGQDDNDNILTIPAYFAYDDVAVIF